MDGPRRFGRYELLEHIATGGMAEVYLARALSEAGFRRRVVVKRIRDDLADNPRFVEMFLKEGRIGAHLNHPNIVQVYEVGRAGPSHYIAMEYLEGKDLTRLAKTLRAQSTALTPPVAVAMVAEVCRALSYAHTRTDSDGEALGIVHRDVSPHNIIVTLAGEVKLVDFGIARLMNTAQGHGTGTGRPGGGKYAYMSPEQASGRPVDHRSDLFSIGIVLWELLAGRRLFKHVDPAEKLRRVRAAEVPHLSTLGIDIPDALWRILAKVLSLDPNERHESAEVLEEDLRAWLFDSRSRVERAGIASLVRAAFPELGEPHASDPPFERLVRDLERLAATDAATSTPLSEPPEASSPGARKPVAVLIVDVDGLTELSDRLDLEDLGRINFRLLRWIRRIVDTHGGLLARAVDDHVTVLFGAHRTRVDDLDRALACARGLIRRAPELARSGGPAVRLAIGVHAGDVTIRTQGRRLRYVARGNTTRLARRLSALADHDEVLVSTDLLRRASTRFQVRSGPMLPGRNGRPGLTTYRVEGRRRGALPAGQGAWLPRGSELDTLRSALVKLTEGRGDVLVLRGDVGVGKSRLLREIKGLAHRSDIPCFVARCDGLGSDRPLEPFRDLVMYMLGADANGPVGPANARVPTLSAVGLNPRDLDAIRTLLGASKGSAAGPEAIRDALLRLCLGLARSGPFIIGLDDVQNLPRTDRLLLDSLVGSVRTAPILFMLSSERTLEPHWTEVRLGPLTATNEERLIAGLLEVDEVHDDLVELVHRSCEGNPLYIEEMIAFLGERDVLAVEGGTVCLRETAVSTLPPSLAALVAARLDALDKVSKGLLQLAAVIGPRFDARVLGEAAGLADPTLLCVELQAHGLITADAGEHQWSFASELVRQAALRGTLGVQRRDYHRMVARAVERCFEDNLDAWREDLIEHCAEGGRPIDAARYAFAVGQDLEREQFLEKAREIYRRGVSALRDAPPEPETYDARVQGEAMLVCQTGIVSTMLGDSADGERSLRLALDIASDVGIHWVELRAHLELGKSYGQRGMASRGDAHLAQARALLAIEPDRAAEIEILEAQAELAFDAGRNSEAEALWQEALDLAQGDPPARARCQLGLANRFLRSGEYERAEPLLQAVLEAASRTGDRILEGRVLNNIGTIHSYAGRIAQALAYYRRALTVREGIGYMRGVVINHHNIGDTYFRAGQSSKAWVAFSRSRELAADMGWDRGIVLNEAYLAYLAAVRDSSSVAPIARVLEQALTLGDGETAASSAWLAGRLHLQRGETDRARSHLERALDLAQEWELSSTIADVETALEKLVTLQG